MRISTLVLSIAAAGSLWPALAAAQQTPAPEQKPANEQVVVPQVDRRDVKLPRYPSKDFEFGIFGGAYATENFGTSGVAGLRVGYHITEDIFTEFTYGRSKVSDQAFRDIFPGVGFFPEPTAKLAYYNVSAGYNVLPGEIFIGRNIAKASAVYVIGGIGSTKFGDQRKQTVNFGLGMRVLFADRWGVRVDLRDHFYSLDLLGKRTGTQNIELTIGASYFY